MMVSAGMPVISSRPRRWILFHSFSQLAEPDRVPLDIIVVDQVVGDEHVHQGQGQRPVRAGTDGNPLVGGAGGAGAGRVDHQHAGAFLRASCTNGHRCMLLVSVFVPHKRISSAWAKSAGAMPMLRPRV